MENERVAEVIVDLMTAYANKKDKPHSFELKALEEGYYFLRENYTGDAVNLDWVADLVMNAASKVE